MSQPSSRLLRASGIVVALLLLWLAFYPGAVASPYVAEDSYRYHHQIVPETAAAYDETVEQAPTYRYGELSPTARTFVDRTRAAPNDEYDPTVCRAFVLTCDAYTESDLPAEFTYGEDVREAEAYVVIQDGDEQFLLQTGRVNHGWFDVPVRFLTAVLALFPLAGVIGATALRSESERSVGGAIAIGVVAGAVAVAAPYVEMYGLLAARTTGFVLLGSVWIGLLAGGGRWLVQRL